MTAAKPTPEQAEALANALQALGVVSGTAVSLAGWTLAQTQQLPSLCLSRLDGAPDQRFQDLDAFRKAHKRRPLLLSPKDAETFVGAVEGMGINLAATGVAVEFGDRRIAWQVGGLVSVSANRGAPEGYLSLKAFREAYNV